MPNKAFVKATGEFNDIHFNIYKGIYTLSLAIPAIE